MMTWAEKDAPTRDEWTGPTGVKFIQIKEPSGVYYHEETPRAVVVALEQARKEHLPVIRIFLGDTETGKDWLEENDTIGRVGCSLGPIKIPLLLKTWRSTGGGGILDQCIVRLQVNGIDVYKHPLYHQPKLEYVPGAAEGYVTGVKADGILIAQFKTLKQRDRWVNFITGRRKRP